MAATKEELSQWFDIGVNKQSDFMIVVCDTFDHEDYPVFCSAEKFAENYDNYNNVNMQRIMEVYDLRMDKQFQMDEKRAFHTPANNACTGLALPSAQLSGSAQPANQ